MRRYLGSVTAFLMSAGGGFASADAVEMPSGLTGYLQEVIADEGAGLYRYRFVAPGFSKSVGLEIVTQDLQHLCDVHAASEVPEGGQIIVSLAGEPTEFGVAAPDVTQVFEAFRTENGRCMWEEY